MTVRGNLYRGFESLLFRHIFRRILKTVKIISTVFNSRSVRMNTLIEGEPLLFCVGSQNFTTTKDIKNLINLNVEVEKKTDPGTNLDLVFVNNDVGNIEGNQFLNEFNGIKIPKGSIKILHRKSNKGWSYGAYSYGFEMLIDKYDYFIFTEDDTLINRKNYALDAINYFKKIKNCGFIAYVGLNYKKYFDLTKTDSIHAHGGIGLSSNDVLKKIKHDHGQLPYYNGSFKDEYSKIIKYGEIKFTNIIYKNGFKLINLSDEVKYFDFSYDYLRGKSVPLKRNLKKKFTAFLNRNKFFKNILIIIFIILIIKIMVDL